MTYNDIIEAIYDKTGRRALVDQTANALGAAARFFHGMENWPRDRIEGTYTIPSPAYRVTFSKSTVLPKLRVVEYIRKWDPAGIDPLSGLATGVAGAFFNNIDTSTLLDSYGAERVNVRWSAGNDIKLVSNTRVDAIAFAYFAWPTLFPLASLDSWFMTEYPELLITNAALRIVTDVGDKEKLALYTREDAGHLAVALASFLTTDAR